MDKLLAIWNRKLCKIEYDMNGKELVFSNKGSLIWMGELLAPKARAASESKAQRNSEEQSTVLEQMLHQIERVRVQ